jgi:hypothetical protein
MDNNISDFFEHLTSIRLVLVQSVKLYDHLDDPSNYALPLYTPPTTPFSLTKTLLWYLYTSHLDYGMLDKSNTEVYIRILLKFVSSPVAIEKCISPTQNQFFFSSKDPDLVEKFFKFDAVDLVDLDTQESKNRKEIMVCFGFDEKLLEMVAFGREAKENDVVIEWAEGVGRQLERYRHFDIDEYIDMMKKVIQKRGLDTQKIINYAKQLIGEGDNDDLDDMIEELIEGLQDL